MKIIDEKPDPSVVKTVICKNCGVKIEYVPNDVKVLYSGRDYGGGSYCTEGFACPKCSKDIIIRSR